MSGWWLVAFIVTMAFVIACCASIIIDAYAIARKLEDDE